MLTQTVEKDVKQNDLELQSLKAIKRILKSQCNKNDINSEELRNIIYENYCRENLKTLADIAYRTSIIPKEIKNAIKEIQNNKNDLELCSKLYKQFIKSFRREQEFKDFASFWSFQQMCKTMEKLSQNDLGQGIKTQNKFTKDINIELLLTFSILQDKKNKNFVFRTKNNLYNIPQLVNWIEENKYKPIEDLTREECEVIYMLIRGNKNDLNTILGFELAIEHKKPSEIQLLIANLPKKFHVENITQVVFRVLLLRPIILTLGHNLRIIHHIKSINKEL